MAYLDIHNKGLSGNTCRIYLSDYGKSLLASCGGFMDKISKFGLSDNDVDYRRFVGTVLVLVKIMRVGLVLLVFMIYQILEGGNLLLFLRIMGLTRVFLLDHDLHLTIIE